MVAKFGKQDMKERRVVGGEKNTVCAKRRARRELKWVVICGDLSAPISAGKGGPARNLVRKAVIDVAAQRRNETTSSNPPFPSFSPFSLNKDYDVKLVRHMRSVFW